MQWISRNRTRLLATEGDLQTDFSENDTSESLWKRGSYTSVCRARPAKSNLSVGNDLGDKRSSSNGWPPPSHRSDPVTPLDRDGNGFGSRHLTNFDYSLIGVLAVTLGWTARCLRTGKTDKEPISRRPREKHLLYPRHLLSGVPRCSRFQSSTQQHGRRRSGTRFGDQPSGRGARPSHGGHRTEPAGSPRSALRALGPPPPPAAE